MSIKETKKRLRILMKLMRCCLTSLAETNMIQPASAKLLLEGTEQQAIQNNLTSLMKVTIATDGDH